jgi:RNA polymerase sigma factor (sigma-70 family)
VVPRPLTEQELVIEATRGDGDAFAALVREHETMAFRTAYLLTSDREEARDATQAGFLKAWQALARFRGAAFRPWLLQIVANEARNRSRAVGRRQALVLRAGAGLAGADAPSAEETMLTSAAKQELWSALERLREEDRLVLSCRFLLELSEAETASVLDLKRGTVKSRTSRALERLQSELESPTPTGEDGGERDV